MIRRADLRTEFARFLIGQKLRVLRLRRSMGLLQLGQHTGLSPSLLSRIENSKHLPTVPTLLRIAMAFDVTLDHFFWNERPERVISITRKTEREQPAGQHPAGTDCCHFISLDSGPGERKFRPYLAEFFPERRAQPHTHQGFEFIHVLGGALGLLIGTEENILDTGDSIYFDSTLRHAYRGLGRQTCTAFVVCACEQNCAERRMDRLEDGRGVRRMAHPSAFPQPAESVAATRRQKSGRKAAQVVSTMQAAAPGLFSASPVNGLHADRAAGARVSHQTMAVKASDFHLDGTLPARPSLRTTKAVSVSPPRTNKNGSLSPTRTNKAVPLSLPRTNKANSHSSPRTNKASSH